MAHILRRYRTLKQQLDARPERCPECRSTQVRLRLYGWIEYDGQIEHYEQLGQIAQMGCLVSEDDPEWDCAECDYTWGQRGESMFELSVWPSRKAERKGRRRR